MMQTETDSTGEQCLVLGKRRPSACSESYFGGPSYLPSSHALPICRFSGHPMTLFLHLAFPEGHPYSGHCLELFASTTYQNDDLDFPEIATFGDGPRDVSAEALQRNGAMHQVCLFPTGDGEVRAEYHSPLKQRFLDTVETSESRGVRTKVGGSPDIVDRELVPKTISGRPAVFLFQLKSRLRYPRLSGGPDQVVGGNRRKPIYGEQTFFELFCGYKMYAFGTPDLDPSSVYLMCLR